MSRRLAIAALVLLALAGLASAGRPEAAGRQLLDDGGHDGGDDYKYLYESYDADYSYYYPYYSYYPAKCYVSQEMYESGFKDFIEHDYKEKYLQKALGYYYNYYSYNYYDGDVNIVAYTLLGAKYYSDYYNYTNKVYGYPIYCKDGYAYVTYCFKLKLLQKKTNYYFYMYPQCITIKVPNNKGEGKGKGEYYYYDNYYYYPHSA